MNRKCAIAAASVLAAGAALTASSTAHAVITAPIRTYTDRATINAESAGSQKGWDTRTTYNQRIILSPHLAMTSTQATTGAGTEAHGTWSSQFVLVGNRSYTKNGDGPWNSTTLSAAHLNSYQQEADPYLILEKFNASRGVQRISATHYSVTGSIMQLSPFTDWEFGVTAANWTAGGIKVITVGFWLDSSGRPIKITAAGRSPAEILTVTQTFGNYNKPLTITAP